MDEKVIAFDAGESRLVELAERYGDEKNYILLQIQRRAVVLL